MWYNNLVIGNPDDKTNFQCKLLLTNTQVANLYKVFIINSPGNIKLSKTQLSKMIKLGGFLDRLLGPLLKTGLPLIKNVIKASAKSFLILSGLTTAVAADAGIHKKTLGSESTTLIMFNDEMEDVMIIVKSPEDSGLILKGISETTQNEEKEQQGGLFSTLLGTLVVS